MIDDVRQFILTRRLIASGDRVMAAVSGGADSVGMLYVLNELRSEFAFELVACHLNHQLRGKAADDDETFVRVLCETLTVPVYVERRDVRSVRAAAGGSLEEVARRVRYDFFERAGQMLRANKIALGHHRDDQCETVVFNLIRGSSIHGVRGIPSCRPIRRGSAVHIIRPMLTTARTTIEAFLTRRRISWRDDQTNFELEANRNVIRHRVLPVMAEVNPSVRDHLVLLSEQAGEMEALLADRAETILQAVRQDENTIRIETRRLRDQPTILASEVVRQMLIRLGAGLKKFTADHFHRIAGLRRGGMDLPGAVQARSENGWLILGRFDVARASDQVEALSVGGRCRFGRLGFSAEPIDADTQAIEAFRRGKTRFEEWIDADKVAGLLHVRYAKAGERFHPLGAPGRKKVGDFLTDVKAGFEARPAVVVADEGGLIWLAGWRIAERVRVTGQTSTILRLSVEEESGT